MKIGPTIKGERGTLFEREPYTEEAMNELIKDEALFLEECVAFIKVLDARARMILAAHEDLGRRRLVGPPADRRRVIVEAARRTKEGPHAEEPNQTS